MFWIIVILCINQFEPLMNVKYEYTFRYFPFLILTVFIRKYDRNIVSTCIVTNQFLIILLNGLTVPWIRRSFALITKCFKDLQKSNFLRFSFEKIVKGGLLRMETWDVQQKHPYKQIDCSQSRPWQSDDHRNKKLSTKTTVQTTQSNLDDSVKQNWSNLLFIPLRMESIPNRIRSFFSIWARRGVTKVLIICRNSQHRFS